VFGLTERTYPTDGWDFITALSNQSFAVNIITGDHDFIDFGNTLTATWVKNKKGLTFTPIRNAGHLLWIDQPEAFTKELAHKLGR
jgi:pimeloyl-ACP methyl ester carboxylesterase